MPTTIQPVIIENIVQFSSLGLFQGGMSRTIGVSPTVPSKMPYAVFVRAAVLHRALIRRTGCPVSVHMFQGRLVAAGYRPGHRDRCPRLTPDHRRMLARRRHNWNRQHSSHVLFADESIVSLYICYGHARVFHHVVERLVDRCIKKTDGVRRHHDQSGGGWPWTHNGIADETSADGSSFGACLPTCVGSSDDDKSVWGIGLDVLSDIQPLLHVHGPSTLCR